MDLNYKVNNNLSLWVRGLNVGNTRCELTVSYSMPGTAVYVNFETIKCRYINKGGGIRYG
jgi:hypothetical protein